MLFLIFVFIVGSVSKMMEIVNNLQYFPKTYYLKCLKNYLIHQKSLWHCPLKHLKCCLNTSKVDSHTMLLSGPSFYICHFFHPSVCLSCIIWNLRNRTSSNHNFWYTGKTMMTSPGVFLFHFFLILIFGVLGG